MTAVSYLPFSHESRPLGKSNFTISPIAWGMWRFGNETVPEARAKVDAALEAGITLFDTADIYGFDGQQGFGDAEAQLGRVFAEDKSLRGKMVLASKGGISIGVPYDQSAAYIQSAIDASLSRLGVDRIDLWQVHRPDILSHPAEVARALEDAKSAGKIGAIGVSNFTVAQISALQHFLDEPLVSVQPELSALQIEPIENGVLDQSMMMETTVLAWSPLGQGRIADPSTQREKDVAAALDLVAHAYGVSRSAAAYSWIMAHPARAIPIIGSQQIARIKEATDAFKVRWTRADWYQVLIASRQEPLP